MPTPPSAPTVPSRLPFHVMAKPIGAKCNLDCTYCFYLEKEALYPGTNDFRMSDAVLERYIADTIMSNPSPEVSFAWQGGEPTLLGIDYFRKIVQFQRRHSGRKVITNALQTNGTLIDGDWARFLAENRFLVGLSIDGPRELHDRYRVDRGRRPTFDRVMAGLGQLKAHGVDFNTLTVVNRDNAAQPLEVYRFLREIGSGFMQFIPVVEREPAPGSPPGRHLAAPPSPAAADFADLPVTPWTVPPDDYGRFLVSIFDEWVQHDVGNVFVQLFDITLANWYGEPPGLCVFSEECGSALVIEHNGDVYSCDHYVYPEHRLGNVVQQSLGAMASSPAQRTFGAAKASTLPAVCRACDVRFACHGECPKHRFARTPDGEPGLNYLCPAYKRFFRHVRPAMDAMVRLLRTGQAPSLVMQDASVLAALRFH